MYCILDALSVLDSNSITLPASAHAVLEPTPTTTVTGGEGVSFLLKHQIITIPVALKRELKRLFVTDAHLITSSKLLGSYR